MQSQERIARLRALASQLERASQDKRRDELLREVRTRITELEAGPALFKPGGAGLARAVSRPGSAMYASSTDTLADRLGC